MMPSQTITPVIAVIGLTRAVLCAGAARSSPPRGRALQPAFVIAQDFLPLQHPVDPMKLISPRDRAEPSTLRVRLEPDNPAERCDRWGAIGSA